MFKKFILRLFNKAEKPESIPEQKINEKDQAETKKRNVRGKNVHCYFETPECGRFCMGCNQLQGFDLTKVKPRKPKKFMTIEELMRIQTLKIVQASTVPLSYFEGGDYRNGNKITQNKDDINHMSKL